MEDNTMLFRQVIFGGLHKGDVLTYIENLEAANEDAKLAMKDEMEHLKNEVEKYKKQCRLSELGGSNNLDSEMLRKLQVNLDASEKARFDLKIQLRQLELQKAELIKRLRDASKENSAAYLSKIKDEARKIIQQQREESEKILENVKQKVSLLIENEKKKNSELQESFTLYSKKLDDAYSELEAVKRELWEEKSDKLNLKEILQQKEDELLSERERNYSFQKEMESKDLEMKIIRQELEEKSVISDSAILPKYEERDIFIKDNQQKSDISLDKDIIGKNLFSDNEVTGERNLFDEEEHISKTYFSSSDMFGSDMDQSMKDDQKVLSDIFSEAKESLNNNEKDKENKIIDLSEVV